MSWEENRVRVSEYGRLSASSPLLAPVPTASGHKQQFVHVLVADNFSRMAVAVMHDCGIRLFVASGRRNHRWDSKKAYEDELVRRYLGVLAKKLKRPVQRAEVIAYGRVYLGFESPHETGLCLDLECGGLAPVSATIAEQEKTPLFLWLKEHAWEYGFSPYKAEPWHLECRLSLEEYRTGKKGVGQVAVIGSLCDEDSQCCESSDGEHGFFA